MPTLPSLSMRSLSSPSVSTKKCPFEPPSTTSALVLPSIILSASGVDIVVHEGAALPPPEVNT